MTLLMRDKEQQKLGKYVDKIEIIKDNKNETEERVPNEKVRKMVKLNIVGYNRIIYFIDNKPEWDDENIAEAILNGQNE